MGDGVLSFAGYWALNSLILWLASLVAPRFVVFGNANFQPTIAVIWTGFILTVVILAVQPTLGQLKIKIKKELHMGLMYLVVNIVALWVLARWLQPMTGFGISAFYVAIVLGVITNFVQYGFWKFVAKKQPAEKAI